MTFAFRKRVERVDWRKLASIDIDKISRDLEFDILQDNIANVAFCNIECELEPRFYDPNFIKLFRLAQLIIEYLLHSQDYLSHTVVQLEERCKSLVVELEKEKTSKGIVENDLISMKDEIKKYKKLTANQNQKALLKVQNNYPCPFCPKNFLSGEYVRMHIKRRHADDAVLMCPVPTTGPVQPAAGNPTDPAVVQACSIIEKLENEVKGLREVMDAERTAKHEDFQRRDWEQFKLELLESHKKEVEMIRDLFLREIECLKQNQAIAERSVDVLQQQLIRAISPTNVVPRPGLPSPSTDPPSKEEFNKLRQHLAEQVDNIVCQRMKEQEDAIQKKIRHALKEHNQELEKLNYVVSTKLKEPGPSPRDDILQSLCDNTKEHAKVLKKQQKKIEDLITTQEEQRHMQLIHEQLQQMNKPALPLPISAPTSPEKKPVNSHRSKRHSDSIDGSPTTYTRSERLQKALKKNPNLIKGLRDELSSMLHEKMQSHGIQPAKSRISTEGLIEALQSLQQDQKLLMEKQPSYKKLRCQYEAQVNRLAKERLQTTLSTITTPLKHRRTKSWSGVSESDSSIMATGEPSIARQNISAGDNVIEKALQRMRGKHRSSSVPRSLNSLGESSIHSGEVAKKSPWKGTGKSLRKFLSNVKTKLSHKSPPKFWQSAHASKSTPELPTTSKQLSPAMGASPKMQTAALEHHSASEEDVTEESSSSDEEDDGDESDDESIEEEETERNVQPKKLGQVQLVTPPSSLSPRSPAMAKTNPKLPVPAKKKESVDWETVSDIEELKDDSSKGKVVTVIPQFHSTPTSKPGTGSSTPVSLMAHSLELQLSGPRSKPFGGVSIIPNASPEIVNNTKKSRMMPTSEDEDSMSLVSLDEVTAANNKNKRLNSSRKDAETFNTNTSSLWQTSGSKLAAEKPTGQRLTAGYGTGSTLKSSTSPWDSEEDDISEIK